MYPSISIQPEMNHLLGVDETASINEDAFSNYFKQKVRTVGQPFA